MWMLLKESHSSCVFHLSPFLHFSHILLVLTETFLPVLLFTVTWACELCSVSVACIALKAYLPRASSNLWWTTCAFLKQAEKAFRLPCWTLWHPLWPLSVFNPSLAGGEEPKPWGVQHEPLMSQTEPVEQQFWVELLVLSVCWVICVCVITFSLQMMRFLKFWSSVSTVFL